MKLTIYYNDNTSYTYGDIVEIDNESHPGTMYIVQEKYPAEHVSQEIKSTIIIDDSIMYMVLTSQECIGGSETTIIHGTVTSFDIVPHADQVRKQGNILKNQIQQEVASVRALKRNDAFGRKKRKQLYMETRK